MKELPHDRLASVFIATALRREWDVCPEGGFGAIPFGHMWGLYLTGIVPLGSPNKKTGLFLPVFSLVFYYGGESGIRTHGTIPRPHDFESCAFNRTQPSLRMLTKNFLSKSLHSASNTPGSTMT